MKPKFEVIPGGKAEAERDVAALIKPLDRDVQPSPSFRLAMRRRLMGLSSASASTPRAA